MGQDAGGRRRQNLGTLRLPDFCNLGTWLRVLLAVNAMALLGAVHGTRRLAALSDAFVESAAYVEPIAIGSLILLCGGQRWFARLTPPLRVLATLLVPLACAAVTAALLAPLDEGQTSLLRIGFWTVLAVGMLLAWFDLAARAYAPAVAEARLMALTARIRPHFLFNSLNAVLGVIRSDPRRAETALEELAELFRSLMQENRDLVPLSSEIALSRQYLDLERLRLGERLEVRWDIESCPPDALVPPLMLQPLLENAVYHGIEPLGERGEIGVTFARRQDRLVFEIVNPCEQAQGGNHHAGNRMALDNIRERLALFFDLEATLTTQTEDRRFVVRIELPYRREGAN
ncbi:MAG: histidine kinase [Gammaproteobacteria bacterium]|nr:histidine kinase [Gammaproteobacteria bacterium]MBU1415120.1 histidine kinase [Gammaproteobacteria bacterium]